MWQPKEDGVAKLVQLLTASTAGDSQQQRVIYEELQQLMQHPEFANYLTTVATMPNIELSVRQQAGLLLKNIIRSQLHKISPQHLQYVKRQILCALADKNSIIRKTVGTIVSEIVCKAGLVSWLTLIDVWDQGLSSNDPCLIDGCLDSLLKVCEDRPTDLISEECRSPLEKYFARLMQLSVSEESGFREKALRCINQFWLFAPPVMFQNLESLIKLFFHLMHDPNQNVRKCVCQALILLVEIRIEVVACAIDQIIEFMIACLNESEEIACDAGEFWMVYCNNNRADLSHIWERLPLILGTLIEKMKFDDMNLPSWVEQENNENIPDRPEEIKPMFHVPRSQESADMGEYHREEVDDWSVRKVSAKALDSLSFAFREHLLLHLNPLVAERLHSNDWKDREAAILCLGIISEGCYLGIAHHLPEVIEMIFKSLSDPNPGVRSISCWCLSRYSLWMLQQPPEQGIFERLIFSIIERMSDVNKNVQGSACTSLAFLIEKAGHRIIPHLGKITEMLLACMQRYQIKNRILLYDVIGTLAEFVGVAVCENGYIDQLLRVLFDQWRAMKENDRSIFPLIESLSYVIMGIGSKFSPYAFGVIEKCLLIGERHYAQFAQYVELISSGHELDPPDYDYLIAALDTLSTIISYIGDGAPLIIEKYSEKLLSLVFQCCKDDTSPWIRQSGLALFGDMARLAIHVVSPHILMYIPSIVANIDPRYPGVLNNASWVVGELAFKLQLHMKPFLDEVLQALISVIINPCLSHDIHGCVAITLGRIGFVCPGEVSQSVGLFLDPWCFVLARYEEDEEKMHAYRGLFRVIAIDPQQAISHIPLIIHLIASWPNAPSVLKEETRQILIGFQTMCGAQWSSIISKCPGTSITYISSVYGVHVT